MPAAGGAAAGVVALTLIVLAALLVPSHLVWVHRIRRFLSAAGWSWPARLTLVGLAATTPVAGFLAVTLVRRDWIATGGWRRLWPLAGIATVAALQAREEARYVDAFDHGDRIVSLLAQGLLAYAILFAVFYMAAHVLLGARRPPSESGAHGAIGVLLVTMQLTAG